MTTPTTHYAPWDADDADVAYCGHTMTAADVHSPAPSCAACAAKLDAEEALAALVELTAAVPLDADEAARDLNPILNAGADLFVYAVSLARRQQGGRS
jgi:hypothetical protein